MKVRWGTGGIGWGEGEPVVDWMRGGHGGRDEGEPVVDEIKGGQPLMGRMRGLVDKEVRVSLWWMR